MKNLSFLGCGFMERIKKSFQKKTFNEDKEIGILLRLSTILFSISVAKDVNIDLLPN